VDGRESEKILMVRIYAKSADESGFKEPLAEHTINDIKAGRRLVTNLPFGPEKKKRIGNDLDECIAFHDIGKAATGFQTALDTRKPWGFRHEILSAASATYALIKDSIVFAVLTHHKTLPYNAAVIGVGCLPDEDIPYLDHISYRGWKEMAKQWYDNLEGLTTEWHMICEHIDREDLLAKKLGLAPLSDKMTCWLRRDSQAKFPYKQREYASLLRGLLMSADHIASAMSGTESKSVSGDHIKIGTNSADDYMPVRIPRLSSYNVGPAKPHGFQIEASRYIGNLILRAPTGSGKTEAALLWAQLNQANNGRLFYALPTMASINAMYLRLRLSLHDTNNKLVGLLHSRTASALYSMFEGNNDNAITNQKAAWKIGSLVREMFFPVRVCTPHQILRYSLQGKGWEAMLSEFPNSVFVFDEIHAYNPKLTGLTMATVKYLAEHKATCIFVTATLPKFIRELIEAEIRVNFIQPSYDNASDRIILEQKRHSLEIVDGNTLSHSNIDLIVKEATKVASTLVVCNHVPTAQKVYRILKDRVKGTVLLHSRFTKRDRNYIESSLQGSLSRILISTQVVEVSLDLSFEQGFTEPAPIDAIVQRMGRINRYASQKHPAKVRIFTKQYSDNNQVYSERLRNRSLTVLSMLPSPLAEEELNDAADRVYGNGYGDKDRAEYEDGLNYGPLKYFKRYLVAGTNEDWIDEIIDKQEGSVDLLPMPLVEEYRTLKDRGRMIEANNLLVPVGRWMLSYFDENRIDKSQDPWVLTGCKYTKDVGLEI
jgi:CRISPR-associated endonuclease/helicase Cas3